MAQPPLRLCVTMVAHLLRAWWAVGKPRRSCGASLVRPLALSIQRQRVRLNGAEDCVGSVNDTLVRSRYLI